MKWYFHYRGQCNYPHPAECDESKAAVRGRKVAGPAAYKNIAEFNEIRTAHSEGSCTRGRPWSEIEAVSAVPYDKAVALAACRQPGAVERIPYIGSERKTPWGKPVSAINTVRKSQAASHWGPWNSAPLPHMVHSPAYLCSNTSSWQILCCAWTP